MSWEDVLKQPFKEDADELTEFMNITPRRNAETDRRVIKGIVDGLDELIDKLDNGEFPYGYEDYYSIEGLLPELGLYEFDSKKVNQMIDSPPQYSTETYESQRTAYDDAMKKLTYMMEKHFQMRDELIKQFKDVKKEIEHLAKFGIDD